jgi:hypothetical protein
VFLHRKIVDQGNFTVDICDSLLLLKDHMYSILNCKMPASDLVNYCEAAKFKDFDESK